MPEEINRICVDHLSEMLFVPTERQKQILLSENIGQEKIFVVGNTIVDAVLDVKHRINIPQQQQILERYGISSESYILVTLHRPSNVDDAETVC